jgi:nucleoside-diphosphate-sugar epimerase
VGSVAGGAGSTPFLAVNTGSDGWNYQIRDLAEEVARVIPGVDVSLAATSGADKRSYRVSFDRYKALALEHQPEFDLRATVEELKEGLEGMGFDTPSFGRLPSCGLSCSRACASAGF